MSQGTTVKQFPSAIDQFAVWENNIDTIAARVPNDIQDQVIAIENALGTNPQGSVSSLKVRLAVSLNDNGTLKGSAVGSTGIQGIQGTTGIQGIQGYTGPQGLQGQTGIQGIQGNTGIQGLQGQTGIQGVQGNTGIQGLQGDTGIQGLQGQTGIQGFQGYTGSQGVKGNQGDAFQVDFFGVLSESVISTVQSGSYTPQSPYMQVVTVDNRSNKTVPAQISGDMSNNAISYDGTSWYNFGQFTGLKGDQGETGVQGIRGNTGLQGIQGNTGVQGIQGNTGVQGIQGATGVQGIQGQTGIQGLQGITGLRGQTGLQGVQGATGIQGIQGTTGVQGLQGNTGVQGITGVFGPIMKEKTITVTAANGEYTFDFTDEGMTDYSSTDYRVCLTPSGSNSTKCWAVLKGTKTQSGFTIALMTGGTNGSGPYNASVGGGGNVNVDVTCVVYGPLVKDKTITVSAATGQYSFDFTDEGLTDYSSTSYRVFLTTTGVNATKCWAVSGLKATTGFTITLMTAGTNGSAPYNASSGGGGNVDVEVVTIKT